MITEGNCSDTCVIYYEGDAAEFYSERMVRARKPHICCECKGRIEAGTQYEKVAGKWDGDFETYCTCTLCVEIRTKYSCDGTWAFTTAWETLEQSLFPHLTTGCLEGLSAAAKAKVVDMWRRWKGLCQSPNSA